MACRKLRLARWDTYQKTCFARTEISFCDGLTSLRDPAGRMTGNTTSSNGEPSLGLCVTCTASERTCTRFAVWRSSVPPYPFALRAT